MKAMIFLLIVTLIGSPLQAKTKPKAASNKNQRVTDADFTGSTVRGKYAHSPESVVSVEKDKKLIPVVEARESFIMQIKQKREDYK